MRRTLKRLARLTVGYSLVTLLGPLFTLALFPIYTRILTPADYGVVDVASTFTGFVSALVVLSLDSALSAYFFDHAVDKTYQRDLVSTVTRFVFGIGCIAALFLIALAQPLAIWLFEDSARSYTFYLIAANAITVPLAGVIGAALRLQMGVRRVNAFAVTYLLSTACTNLVVLFVLRMRATGIIAANTVTNVFVLLIGLWLAGPLLRGTFRSQLLRPVLRAGVQLLPGTISFLLLASIDRVLLTQYVDLDQLGLYSTANKWASILAIVINTAWMAWFALANEMGNRLDAPRQFARFCDYFVAGSAWLALALGLFAPELLALLARPNYVPAAPYALVLLACVGPISYLIQSFQLSTYVSRHTWITSAAYGIGALVNVVLNLVLSPQLGVWGAVWATVAGAIVVAVVMGVLAQRAKFVPYHWHRLGTVFSAYSILVAVFLMWPALNIAYKFGALLALAAVSVATGIISSAEMRIAIDFLRYRFQLLRRSLCH